MSLCAEKKPTFYHPICQKTASGPSGGDGHSGSDGAPSGGGDDNSDDGRGQEFLRWLGDKLFTGGIVCAFV